MASEAVQASESRDDLRKKIQLQEAKASGQAPADVDVKTGQMINPHNPSFIVDAPWYVKQADGPTLDHQKAWNMKPQATKGWYIRGTKGDVKTKFLKGACENCGATTHTKKDCTERPRKVGAKFTGKDLAPDEHVQDLVLDYAGKRDNYNGYDPDSYKEVIEEYERIEMERKRQRAVELDEKAKKKAASRADRQKRRADAKKKKMEKKAADGEGTDSGTDTDSDSDSDSDNDSDDEDDGTRIRESSAKVHDTKDTARGTLSTRTTTRNLRIREDTAKYLLNLDTNSAFYDPKTRSMRENPLGHLKEEEQALFKGDNHLRQAGDVQGLKDLERFAWDTYSSGNSQVNALALPTQAAKLQEVFKDRQEEAKEQKKDELINKYGGTEHMKIPETILNAETEQYVEYSRDGRVIKGQERAMAKSKYMEDVHPGNHSSIFGSWYCTRTNAWGYRCCHATYLNAYCTELPGGAAAPSAPALAAPEPTSPKSPKKGAGSPEKPENGDVEAKAEPGAAAEAPLVDLAQKAGKKRKKEKSDSSGSDSSSSDSSDSDSDSSSSSSSSEKKKKKKKAKKAKTESSGMLAGVESGAAAKEKEKKKNKKDQEKERERNSAFGHNLEDVDHTTLDPKKVEKAKKKLMKERKNFEKDERKQKYNSLSADNVNVTAEEYEAYLQSKPKFDDPMRQMMNM